MVRFRGWMLLFAVVPAAGLAVVWWWSRPTWPAGAPELAPHVHARPAMAVVFTSRTGASSLRAPADEGERFRYPGKSLWQEKEGRLRLLRPDGEVAELTWGKKLSDGSTLIDVMSPSISPDGKKIIFAGRKAPPDPGHFRLYEIGVDGTSLRQLTGGPDDPGCTAVPPLRYSENGEKVLSDEQRKRIDYDDVDPVYAPGGHIVFASTRTPDLGRDHARRSTTLWIMREDGTDKKPLSSNRNNDRWPYIAPNGYVVFSLWSRNREVITADLSGVEPYEPGKPYATQPTDAWLGAHIEPNADYFGSVVKVPQPVWRPRLLSNGRYAFMTTFDDAADPLRGLTVVQAKPGVVANAPSSLPIDAALPRPLQPLLVRGPQRDADGSPLRLATPSACPPDHLLLAGATPEQDGSWKAERYGLYIARDNWRPNSGDTASANDVDLELLFDDPNFVDAEPVGVYERNIQYEYHSLENGDGVADILLANGRPYHGPTGEVHNSTVFLENNSEVPGQRTDVNQSPIFSAPPEDSIKSIRVFASHRDRFDDPQQPRLKGSWELLLEAPVENGSFRFRMPTGIPTVLAGFDAQGKVMQWTSVARDSLGEQARFFAFAGDHYSGARAGFPHFCTGCHTGHSGTPTLRGSFDTNP